VRERMAVGEGGGAEEGGGVGENGGSGTMLYFKIALQGGVRWKPLRSVYFDHHSGEKAVSYRMVVKAFSLSLTTL